MFAADTKVACQVHPSPNHGERKQDKKPSILVLHYTGMETAEAALDWLCAEESQVSSHYLIDEDGAIVQTGAGGCACLACGRVQLARRDGYQFGLNRD